MRIVPGILVFISLLSLVASAQYVYDPNAPNSGHARLYDLIGEWDVVGKGSDLSGIEYEYKGKAKISKVLDGRFVKEEFEGTLEYKGVKESVKNSISQIAYYGYDNIKGKYTLVWMDSTDNSTYVAESYVPEKGKIFTYYRKTNEGPFSQKYILTIKDKDNHIFEEYRMDNQNKSEFKYNLISKATYKRQK